MTFVVVAANIASGSAVIRESEWERWGGNINSFHPAILLAGKKRYPQTAFPPCWEIKKKVLQAKVA